MSKQYINKEIDKIFESSDFNDKLKEAMACAWILGNFKGINLKVMDLSSTSSVADYYVLGSVTNSTQASSMADEVIDQLRRKEIKIISKEGSSDSDWILIDAGNVIVHIFQESARDAYGLEELWSESYSIPIPNEYYFSSESEESNSTMDDKGRDFF